MAPGLRLARTSRRPGRTPETAPGTSVCAASHSLTAFIRPIAFMPQSEGSTIPEVTPELPVPSWRLILALLGRLPARGLSRSFGRVADIPLAPPLRRPVLGAFARGVGIDLSEAERPLEEYPS